TVSATDAYGNVDPTPAVFTWTLDQVPPVPRFTGGPAEDAHTSPTNTFSFTSNEPGGSFQCRVDFGPWEPCTSPQTVSDMWPGDNWFGVIATDPAGNASYPVTRHYVVDGTAPTVSLGKLP